MALKKTKRPLEFLNERVLEISTGPMIRVGNSFGQDEKQPKKFETKKSLGSSKLTKLPASK